MFQSLFIFLGSIIIEHKIIFSLFILLFYIYLFNKFSIVKKISIFLKDFLTSPKTNQIAIYFGFILLFSIILSIIFLGEHYLLIGFLPDTWIPQLSAYVIKHGLRLHQDFHTPFGFVYGGLNYTSLLIMESFPDTFHLLDMTMLSSILFSLIIIGLFYLMRFNIVKAVPIALLLIILSIIFQVKIMSDMFNIEARYWWNGSYNKHLWGLFLLQIVHLFCWRKFFVKNIDNVVQIEKNRFIFFLIIQVICAYILLNYKLNFFIASSLLIFSIFLILPFKLWFKYIVFSISLFLFLTLSTFILSQYSYIGYLQDIYHVILSKKEVYLELNYFFIYLFVCFLMRVCTELLKKIPKEKNPIEFLKYYFYKSKIFLAENKSILTKWFLFDLCVGVSLSIGMVNDKEKSLLYFLIAIFLYLIINIKNINFEKGFYWILTVLFVINTSFLANAYFGLNYIFAYPFIFFLVRVFILLFLKKSLNKTRLLDFFKHYIEEPKPLLNKLANKVKLSNLSYYFHQLKSFLTNNNFLLIRQLLFDFCIGLSILICIIGDAEKPLLYFLIVFLFYLIINTNMINIKRVCYLILAILFTINISSLAKMAIFKFYKEDQLMTDQPKHQKYKIHSIKVRDRNYPFIIENKESMDQILNELRVHSNKYKGLFEGIVYNDKDLNYKMYRNNVYYIDYLNDALLVFRNKLDKIDKGLLLDFINPLPILLNLKPIKGSYHWFHIGFTFSSETIHRFNKTFENSDFVYMPLLSPSNQLILKCHFYKWNFHHKRFALSTIHRYGFLFATHQKIKEYNLQELESLNQDKIAKSCVVIENDLVEKEKNQQKNILIRLLQKISL